MKKTILNTITVVFVLLMESVQLCAQTTVNYTASTAIIPNPERGWYLHCDATMPVYNTNANQWPTEAYLKSYHDQGYRLVKRYFTIPSNTAAIPQWFLDSLNHEAGRFRKVGMKYISCFCYNWNQTISSADASLVVTTSHMDQLKSYYETNCDVLYQLEMGFIGLWGEMHHSSNGHIFPGSIGLTASGKAIMAKILAIVPIERTISMRYPYVIYGPDSYGTLGYHTHITEATAYNGSDQSRVVSWYANFGAGDVHWALDTDMMTNWAAQSEFLPTTGHCDVFETVDMDSQKWLTDAKTFHYCALSNPKDYAGGTGPSIYNQMLADGVYDTYAKYLGYRFSLVTATIPATAQTNSVFTITMTIANDGWSRPMNPRTIEFVFRNIATSADYKVPYTMPIDSRLWLPGPESQNTQTVQFVLPASIPAGNYRILVNMPDPKASIANNPDFSIQFANTEIWEAATGYNDMLATVVIIAGTSDIQAPTVPTLVYPNPATNLLTIGNLKANSKVTVLSLAGKQISKQKGVNDEVVFNVSNWEKGMYLVRVENVGKITNQKVIVQ